MRPTIFMNELLRRSARMGFGSASLAIEFASLAGSSAAWPRSLLIIMLEPAMPDRRECARIAMDAVVVVRHPQVGTLNCKTRDISDGGVYVLVESGDFPPLGSIVEVQVQGLAVPAPILSMRVVRQTADGFGMRFA